MASICFDCSYGVSGDMLVGAMLDLGVDSKELQNVIDSLGLIGYDILVTKINKKGTPATDFDVALEENSHDHDMDYLYKDKKIVEQKALPNRKLKDVKKIIENSLLSTAAKKTAIKIFEIVAIAEGRAHGIDASEVTFHESGAMDSIIDISAIAFCLDALHVEKVYAINLCEGHGFINTRVGKLPIPTPAVKNIAEEYNIPLNSIDVDVELITPTGLASLAAVADFGSKPNGKVKKIGYGAGKRDYNLPCVLKAEVY